MDARGSIRGVVSNGTGSVSNPNLPSKLVVSVGEGCLPGFWVCCFFLPRAELDVVGEAKAAEWIGIDSERKFRFQSGVGNTEFLSSQ